MPRPTRAYGRPNTHVMPPRWSEQHQPPWSDWRRVTVSLRAPGGVEQSFSEESGAVFAAYPAYYTGPARITLASSQDAERSGLSAAQLVTAAVYSVELDPDVTGVQLDDVLTVEEVDGNADPELFGVEMHVLADVRGSTHWSRRLLVWQSMETQAEEA